jgi:hypothetical protein
MKKFAIVVSLLLSCFAGPASAQDIERVRQIDRVCVGRMLIVQTMAVVKERGKAEEQYRAENPFDQHWKPVMKEEVSAVISYVFSHSWEENMQFSNAVMETCYKQNQES